MWSSEEKISISMFSALVAWLTLAEENYAIMNLEALAIVWYIKYNWQYQ